MKRLILPVGAVLAACSADSSVSNSTSQAVTGNCATPVIVDQSLFVASVDGSGNSNAFGVAALADFSFQKVLNKIISTGASGSGQTALQLYQQMLDTFDKPPCTGTINGFPVDCPRPEGALGATDPFSAGKTGFMHPVALVNRFDLAPSNGANCGQYRIVYAVDTNLLPPGVSRFLMILEAVLPNPVPSQGLAACLPVAQFWDNLSAPGITTTQFAADLDTFYFKGIAGLPGNPAFPPVVTAQAYGIGAPSNTNTGQIRVNMLSTEQWQLREFTLSQSCTTGGDGGTACTLAGNNTFVKNNPFGGLFQTSGDANGFQAEFIKQVKSLASSNINLIGMKTPNVDNAGQSSEQDDTNDYSCNAGFTRASGDFLCGSFSQNTSLASAIQTELTAIGSTLTPTDILQRATTQSCAGCHELSPGTSLGGGLTWPQSEGFTQVNESGFQSVALTGTFLPFRSKVLTRFIDNHCGADGGAALAEGDGTTTVGGQVSGSSN